MPSAKAWLLGTSAVAAGAVAVFAVREVFRIVYSMVSCAHCARRDRPLTKCIHCNVVAYCSQECHSAAFDKHSKVCHKPRWEEVLALVRINYQLQNFEGVVEWSHRGGELLHHADEAGRKAIRDMFESAAAQLEARRARAGVAL